MAINYPQRYDDDFLNTIKTVIDHVNAHGKTIQDLVADGQLTEEQYANLINTVNGMIKSGEVDRTDLTPELRSEVDKVKNKIDKGEVTIYDINKNKGKLDQTYLTDELLQQIAGTADINAVPAKGSITKEHLSNGSVTPDKMSFIDRGTNLFGEGNLTAGYSLANDGTEEVSFSSTVSDFQEVDQTTYTFRGVSNLCLYDANKNFLSRRQYIADNEYSYEIPADTFYIKISFPTDLFDFLRFNKGTTIDENSIYKTPKINRGDINFEIREEDALFINQTKMVAEESTFVNEGYFNTGSNSFVSSPDFKSTDKTRIEERVTLTSKGIARVIYFDENGDYLDDQSLVPESTRTFSTPLGTRYLIANAPSDAVVDAQLNEGFEIIPKEEAYENHIKPELIKLKDKSVKASHLNDDLLGEGGKLLDRHDVYRASAKPNTLYPRPQLVITYDDNPVTDYTLAFPVHQKYGLPGEVCVVTDFITGRLANFPNFTHRSMTIEELKEMQDAGWEVSSHSKTHRSLGMGNLTSISGGTPKGSNHWYVGSIYRWNHESAIPFEARVFSHIDESIDEIITITGTGTDSDGVEYLISDEPAQFDHTPGGSAFTASENELYKEIVGSVLELNSMGFNANSISYPYNANSHLTRKIVSKHLISGREGTGDFTGGFMSGIDDFLPTQNLNSYAECSKWSELQIDTMLTELVDNNALGMIFEHSWSEGFNPDRLDYLLSKAIELGVEVTTRTEALKRHGNRCHIGDPFKSRIAYVEPEDYFIINALGKEFIGQ